MELIDNISQLFGDDLKKTLVPGAKFKVAASCFSIYAFEALKAELERVESLEFIFTKPTFVPDEATDALKKEKREFHIPKSERERSFYGTEFEIQLKNKLTQRAIAKECADWMRRKARFRSNRGKAPMQQFACVKAESGEATYLPLHGFTAVDLGYQRGDAVSNIVNKIDEPTMTPVYLSLFEQIWNDPEKLEDVTERLCEHIASVYQENSPERIYFLMLYNIFSEFLEDLNEDVLPNDLTGYQDSLVWQKLYNFQRDAATGIINKLETYNGCILADSVGLGKTFTALAVIKYYELRNRSILVLCPKKLADNWLTYNHNLKTNIFARDRFNYDVLYAPVNYVLPSRLAKYEDLYDTELERGTGKFRQADRERSLQALMTVNLLKRLEGMNGATGLYCGEQDMFAFLIDPTGWTEIEGESFAPGFFVWNSEVGRRSIGLQTFWFQAVCQNHIVWDAIEVVDFSRKHTANVHDALLDIRRGIDELVVKRDTRRDRFVDAIGNAMRQRLGDDAEEVMKKLAEHGISRSLAKQATELAASQGRFTIFSLVDALTRLTGRVQWIGKRTDADQQAASLLALAL